MPPEELKILISTLALWCNAGHGRAKLIADELDVNEQMVSNWLSGRKTPSLKNYFALQAFLKKKLNETNLEDLIKTKPKARKPKP